jgi:MoaA/NifB/PqqE/SkfB family radical SAM enzyme
MYLQQDGQAFACCYADRTLPIGDLRRSSLREIWNGPEYRAMRLRMLSGEPSAACTRCYELEQAGARSQRVHMNRKFAHHLPLVRSTAPDGAVAELNLPFVDIRFSNVCNFKCRSCEHGSSSNWYGDARALDPDAELVPILRPRDDPEQLWAEVRDIIPRAEEIYFAGGEPLIMDEHYRILDLLVEQGRTNVELVYNTNLSVLAHRGRDVLSMWRRFPRLRVHVSLDGSGRRGEILRHGMVWTDVLDNCRRLRAACPHARFMVAATVSAMNVMHLPDLHRELVGLGVIGVEGLEVHNIVATPEHLRIQILPAALKREVERIYRGHLDWLARAHALGVGSRVYDGFQNVVRFMNQSDRSPLIPAFVDYTRRLDRLRGEAFFDTFPELASLSSSASLGAIAVDGVER